ncbi:GNAT family N-acetyltransferase [Streptomyces sp. NBC_01022]|uniref:GNAT family N-acetyltransferase n=1 Tax=Streptomyces sp. NBC_01022 TaxID=2903723 RepID=UPI002DD8F2A0|nr:GNAT family N-acetyltransferase [Streptomyces sp. NBC_01022]WRZ85477.1 GNAT family N-acetyltransferase [Streptomyces sp. NBC_01022]
MPTWTISAEPVTGTGIDDLMSQYFSEMGPRVLGRPVTEAELREVLDRDPHDDLGPPHGEFLVARDGDGALLGCAGVRLLTGAPVTAELKRMYVRPAGRGAGLGRGLLAAVEAAAQRLGASRIVCETNAQLTEARALYTAHGYDETAPYEGHGRADHWYVKSLGREDRAEHL